MNFDFSKYNPYFILFVLLIIPFIAYLYRPDFIGFDPYGFLLLTCNANNAAGLTGITHAIFSNLLCNFITLKIMLFSLAFISGCFIIKTAKLFSPKHGWKASYLIFLSSVYVLEFSKLENEAIAFTILFASLYLFFKGFKIVKNSRKNHLTAFALVILAGLIWKGSIFYLIGYLLNISILIIALLPALTIPFKGNFLYWKSLLENIIGTNNIAENQPFKFHRHFALNPGLIGALLEPLLLPQTLLYFALGTASSKYWILTLPFLTIGMVIIHQKLSQSNKFESKHTTFLDKIFQKAINFFETNHSQIFAILSIFTVIAITQSILLNPPQQSDWEPIEYALSIDNNVNNDWSIGYWILWKGGTTQSYQSPQKQTPFFPGQIVVTQQDNNCSNIKTFEDFNVMQC